jgi:rod shape determining protein RodA
LFLPNTRGRWIELGGFQFQPSELMKVFYIILLAKVYSRFTHKDVYFPQLLIPLLLTILPVLLIFFEPDIGTAAIFIVIFLGMLATIGIPLPRYFLYISPLLSLLCGFNLISWIIFMVILISALLFSNIKFRDGLLLFLLNVLLGSLAPKLPLLLKPYQKERLMSFLNPSWDPTGAGWHILQSKISIGSGGLFGKGYLNGIIKNLGFLPQTRTDFIFAVLGEEFGFLGTSILILLFAYFLWKILILARASKEPFKKYLAYGILFYFSSHIVINIGMTIGLLPVVGLPLPFISYGGTSMVVSTIFIGLIFSIRERLYE